MSTEDQRERDQMWKRIDSHGGRLNDLERGLTEMKGHVDENGRSITDLTESLRKNESATNQVHLDLNTLIGQGQAMKKIATILSIVLIVIQVLDAMSDSEFWPL